MTPYQSRMVTLFQRRRYSKWHNINPDWCLLSQRRCYSKWQQINPGWCLLSQRWGDSMRADQFTLVSILFQRRCYGKQQQINTGWYLLSQRWCCSKWHHGVSVSEATNFQGAHCFSGTISKLCKHKNPRDLIGDAAITWPLWKSGKPVAVFKFLARYYGWWCLPLRLSIYTEITIHWKALEEHFLMVPLVLLTIFGDNLFSESF
jgi:hypothetical protein